MAASAGSRFIGDYELLAKLGEGGMGAVYKARQRHLDRIIALKVLAPALAGHADYIQRFMREARATARLNHPHIISGIDVGCVDGHYFFAMELVEGETLRQRIEREGPLPEREVMRIGAAIASALAHAHLNGLVHRDVKPDNILIDTTGTPKLADLGLSKGTVDEDASLTKSGFAVGTPNYMSPEQVEGRRDVDGRADAYALGCTLYHAATGRPPFQGPSAAVVMVMHLKERMEHPQALREDLSDECCALLGRLCELDREQRYANLADAAEDMEALSQGLAPQRLQGAVALPFKPFVKGRGRARVPDRRPSEKVLATSRSRLPAERRGTTGPRRPAGNGMLAGGVLIGLALLLGGLALWLKGGGTPSAEGAAAVRPEAKTSQAGKESKTVRESKTAPEAPAPVGIRDPLAAKTPVLPAESAAPGPPKIIRDPTEKLLPNPFASIAPVAAPAGPAVPVLLKSPPGSGWMALFNGATLEGWEQTAPGAQVVEGAIRLAGKAEIAKPIAMADYEVSGEFRLLGGDGSRWPAVGTIVMRRVGEGRGTGARCTFFKDGDVHFRQQGREDLFTKSGSGRVPMERWLPFTARIQGERVSLRVNGQLLIDGRSIFAEPGFLSFHGHGGNEDSVWELRNLFWRPLTSASPPAADPEGPGAARDLYRRMRAALVELAQLNPNYDGKFYYEVLPGGAPSLRIEVSRISNIEPLARLSGLKHLGLIADGPERSPLIGLASLSNLALESLHLINTSVADLTPLRGLPLSTLDLTRSRVHNLNPLAGLPLETLILDRNPVTNLEPLAGCRKLRALSLAGSAVQDLKPLRQTMLYSLVLSGTPVRDLSPLARQPLCYVRLDDCAEIKDFSPLNAVRLRTLWLDRPEQHVDWLARHTTLQRIGTADRSIERGEFLRQCGRSDEAGPAAAAATFDLAWVAATAPLPLDQALPAIGAKLLALNPAFGGGLVADPGRPGQGLGLELHAAGLTDLRPLQALPQLQRLKISGAIRGQEDPAMLSDLSGLRGMKLRELDCSQTRVANLEPLAGMPLRVLKLNATQVQDVSALREMPLEELTLDGAPVRSLEPLRNMATLHTLRIANCTSLQDTKLVAGLALIELKCDGTALKLDESLARMPLQRLWQPQPGALPCDLPHLTALNGFPPGEARVLAPAK
ncbi:MAG: protein kinase [Planctomycetes bacterium]|nr:protein kinase [Planctomycetota bacterium]